MPIEVFAFDCGGVLLRDGDSGPYAKWENHTGLKPGQLREILWEGDLWRQAERGEITDDAFWSAAGRSLALDGSEIGQLREDLWGAWTLDTDVLALVRRARQDHRTVLLSNASDALEDMLQCRYQVAKEFEHIYCSARMGVAKPDPAIYQRMLNQLGVPPQNVLFVDDRPENICAAAALGLHVIWFVNAQELERQLHLHLPSNEDATNSHARVLNGSEPSPATVQEQTERR